MGRWELPKHQEAAQRLRQAAARGSLTHALLLSGSGDLAEAALFAAGAHLCTAAGERPCGECPACRKVRSGIHPDVITVRDEAHANIAVDVVRGIRADAYIRPNEGARKVYLFPDCALLTEADQNILLKVVEEGPPYAAFLFCAENPTAVLPTLRSRCVELKLRPTASSAVLSERGTGLCEAAAGKKPGAITEKLIRLEREKLPREELQSLLEELRGAYAAALLTGYGCTSADFAGECAENLAKTLTKTQVMRTIELLRTYRQQCQYNVSVGQVLGALSVEWEGIL